MPNKEYPNDLKITVICDKRDFADMIRRCERLQAANCCTGCFFEVFNCEKIEDVVDFEIIGEDE